MNSWQKSLDKYLTEPPDDGFDNWAEVIVDEFSNSFYDEYYYWINDTSTHAQCNEWMNTLFYKKGASPEDAAKIIERAFFLYKIHKL